MAVMDGYEQGAPCWFELATTDQTSAKQFYTQLFGWNANDFPTGPAGSYTMFDKGGQQSGACYTLEPSMLEQGVPPNWGVYFAVKDVDASTAKTASLGGTVIAPAFDVMTFGRMSVCRDPGGAVFMLWQAKSHQGAGIYNEDNAVCWVELATWDVPQARDFYTNLLGWKTKSSAGMETYVEYGLGGYPLGGLLPMDENWKGIPSNWSIYLRVNDLDSYASKAKELGGAIMVPPFDVPNVGRMARLTDPQGAGFYLIQLANPSM
ncbi:MAG: VOC family protein [Acidobacteriaceae bacterium]|nr:VOC family protein [Acidobacteriaceae bacterium]